MAYTVLKIEPHESTFVAEVHGVDLARPLLPQHEPALLQAWSRHPVLVFRGQQLDDASHGDFAARLGAPAIFSDAAGDARIYGSANVDGMGHLLPEGDERATLLRMNWHWHVDGCYRDRPNKAVVLRAIEVPGEGGDTLFADLRLACASLPGTLRSRIGGCLCLHSFAHMIRCCGMPDISPDEAEGLPHACHPLVWRRADGSESLFLSPPYMSSIDGLGSDETRALVDELARWATQERFVYRHRWQAGDVLVWDNRWTMHRVSPYDLSRHRRVMRGATLLGDEAVTG